MASISGIILAGGISKRYGKNKLLETFFGKTLIEYNMDFLKLNKIDDIHIVYYDEDVKKYLMNKTSIPISNVSFHKRVDYPHGTGMSLLTPINKTHERIIVIFGDNFYYGNISNKRIESDSNIATFRYFEKDPNNLRFAAIVDNKIIEKPHDIKVGNYFVGYLILNRDELLENGYTISNRGEVEIVDLFNKLKKKQILEIDVIWDEITYLDDYSKMLKTIENSK